MSFLSKLFKRKQTIRKVATPIEAPKELYSSSEMANIMPMQADDLRIAISSGNISSERIDEMLKSQSKQMQDAIAKAKLGQNQSFGTENSTPIKYYGIPEPAHLTDLNASVSTTSNIGKSRIADSGIDNQLGTQNIVRPRYRK